MSKKKEKPEAEGDAKPKGGKLKLILFTAVLVAGVGAGAFIMGGKGAAAKAEESAATESEAAESEAPEETAVGEVVLIDPVTLSLADGHYLKVGLALQLAAPEGEEAAAAEGGHGGGGDEEPAMSAEETARAVDEAIELFGSRTMEQLRLPKHRQEAKEKLVHALEEAYHGKIVDVYFTAFAMQ